MNGFALGVVIKDFMMKEAFLWVEKYRPKTISDCILPESIKNTFIEFVGQKEIPNLLY